MLEAKGLVLMQKNQLQPLQRNSCVEDVKLLLKNQKKKKS
jgi:hypothetical protein